MLNTLPKILLSGLNVGKLGQAPAFFGFSFVTENVLTQENSIFFYVFEINAYLGPSPKVCNGGCFEEIVND